MIWCQIVGLNGRKLVKEGDVCAKFQNWWAAAKYKNWEFRASKWVAPDYGMLCPKVLGTWKQAIWKNSKKYSIYSCAKFQMSQSVMGWTQGQQTQWLDANPTPSSTRWREGQRSGWRATRSWIQSLASSQIFCNVKQCKQCFWVWTKFWPLLRKFVT